jgi:glycosyltransferase involved in cell wall biosynthesis
VEHDSRIVSVITPVYNPRPDFLRAAYDSLCHQELPHGYEWEWVVQEDGNTCVAQDVLPDDPRISHGTGRRGGVAITRNLAVARARGTLLKNLDQDDILTAGVLYRDVEILSANPDIQWTTSRVLDLLPDGTTVGFEGDPSAGRILPGFVLSYWESHDYRLPVHPTTICIRRQLLTALGGWMAVPGSDDTGLLVAASVISVGYFHAEVGLFYRKWPGQVTADASHRQPVEWNLRMSLINERARSLAELWGCHEGRAFPPDRLATPD